MNKFVLSALALSAASTPCLAGTGSDDAWLGIDRDINALSTSLAPASTGASVSAFIKTSYANSSDIQVGGNDLGGFLLNNARLNFSGSVGDYSLFVALEGADGSTGGPVGVLDAIASVNITDQIKGSMGQFRPGFLASSLRSEDNLLFIDRTVQGDSWAFRDQGASLSGNFDQLGWWFGLQNGNDGAGNDLVISARVTFDALGTGAAKTCEGAYGATGTQNLTIGVGYYDDANVDKGTAWCADVYFNAGPFSASAEIVDYDNGFTDTAAPVTASSPLFGETPWDVSAGWMVVPDQWEVALRFEDFDDTDNTTAVTGGVNWYQSGHAAKWQLNYTTTQSDNNALEADILQIALVASI